jgi:class 3 adenylate cyclase
MKTIISTFKSTASFPEHAIVMTFDLEGFSQFFSQPDVHNYVPKYLNVVMEALDLIINGGDLYWGSDTKIKKFKVGKSMPKPMHSKFLGDGALYVWRYHDFTAATIINLVNSLFNFANGFEKVVQKATEDVPVVDYPKRIRIGISAGSVYKLTYSNSNKEEYIGYCINLASRLQNYCRELGFLVSARLSLSSSQLQKDDYVKVVATKIKGFPRELVIVDKASFINLSETRRNELFEDPNGTNN